MDKATLAVALIGVALAGGGSWQTLQSADLQADIDVLHKSQQNWDKERQDRAVQYNNAIASLRQQLQDAQNQLELAKAKPTEPAPAQLKAPAVASSGNTAITTAKYLAPDQRTAHAEYQKQAPARARETLAKSFAIMLQLGVPTLSEQSRAVVSSVYSEIAARPFSRNDGLTAMERMYQNYDEVVAKLQGEIPEDEVKLVRDYFKYRRRMNEALSPDR